MMFIEEIILNDWLIPVNNYKTRELPKWIEPHPKYINKRKKDATTVNKNNLEKFAIKAFFNDDISRDVILEIINKDEFQVVSVTGYKGKFVVKNNVATLILRGYKRIFTQFTTNELEEILMLLKYSFKNDKLNPKVSANRYLYYLKVWRETEKNAMHIENIDIRGVNYHIDHIMPINFCYANNICHIKAGGIKNLQMLSRKDNLNKNKKVNVAEIYRVY